MTPAPTAPASRRGLMQPAAHKSRPSHFQIKLRRRGGTQRAEPGPLRIPSLTPSTERMSAWRPSDKLWTARWPKTLPSPVVVRDQATSFPQVSTGSIREGRRPLVRLTFFFGAPETRGWTTLESLRGTNFLAEFFLQICRTLPRPTDQDTAPSHPPFRRPPLAQLPGAGAGDPGVLAGGGDLRRVPGQRRRGGAVHAPRRPPVRQRLPPHGPRPQQGAPPPSALLSTA